MKFAHLAAASASRKILMSLTALGVAGSMATLGSYATFADTETGSTAIDTGIVSMTIGTTGTAANRLSVAATDIVPGDTIARAANLTVDSSTTSALASIKLTTTGSASPSTLLTSDTGNGLQVKIDKCSVAWTESVSAPYTYTCSGTTSAVLTTRAIIGADLALSNLDLTAGATNYLVVTANLPSTAGNTFQNLADTITYSFTGTQRTATNK